MGSQKTGTVSVKWKVAFIRIVMVVCALMVSLVLRHFGLIHAPILR